MWQRRRQEEHRQQEAQRLERERRLHTSLVQEEGVHGRRYVRQVREELKERQTQSALLKVHYGPRSSCHEQLLVICGCWFLSPYSQPESG